MVDHVLNNANHSDEWRSAAVQLVKLLQEDVAAIERQFDTRSQQISVGMKFYGEADVQKFESWRESAGKAATTKLSQIRLIEQKIWNVGGDEIPRAMLHADVLYEIALEASEWPDKSERMESLMEKLDNIWPRWRLPADRG